MKRIIIIGEGQTEQAFCKDILQPYFNKHDIYIQNPTIKKSKGGIVSWLELKKQITNHLIQDKTAKVTLLIDYYGLTQRLAFPKWEEAKQIVNPGERMSFLEKAMLEDLEEKYSNRFIAYIQVHEFEGLLFSDIKAFDANFDKHEFADYEYLKETINSFDNPEDINDSPDTAPSKRLARIIKAYQKTVWGPLLADEIGLEKIRSKCPRFNSWVEKLSKI